MQKLLIIFFITLAFLMSVSGQEATEEAPVESIQFAAFTLPNLLLNGIYPAGWEEVQAGAYVRNDELNTTYILHLGEKDTSLDGLIAPILPSVQLEKLPEPIEIYESAMLEWTLYNFEYSPSELEGENLQVDLATAENDDGAYLILLQTMPDDYESLHEQVFMPALDAFGLPLEIIFEEYNITTLEHIIIDEFGIESAIPDDWQQIAVGSYMRAANQQDITTLLIQTSPDLTAEAFANLLLDSLGLSVDLPESDTIHETDYLSWSIYLIEVNSQGVDITFQIATAQDEQFAYLVVLLNFSEETPILQDTVLLPILDMTKAIEE